MGRNVAIAVGVALVALIWFAVERRSSPRGHAATPTTARDGEALAGATFDIADANAPEPVGDSPPTRAAVAVEPLVPSIGAVTASAAPVVDDAAVQHRSSLTGWVRDESGAPVAGAKVIAWPEIREPGIRRLRSGSQMESDAAGAFRIDLTEDVPHALSALADGYRAPDLAERFYAPGTVGIELALERLPLARFLVVDDATGVPVERFGIEIDPTYQSPIAFGRPSRRPRSSPHPGRVVETHARVALDSFTVAADGYVVEHGEVGPESAFGQTIRLRRGSTVRGRLVDGVRPVENAAVTLVPRVPLAERWLDPQPVGHTRTAANGAFELAAVDGGEYSLRMRPFGGAPFERDVRVDGRNDVDLGDIAVVPGGSITGDVLLPDGVDPRAVTVRLDHGGATGATARLDANARFRFRRVGSGSVSVAVESTLDVIDGGARTGLVLAPGEARHVTIDARDHALGIAELTVIRNGAPASGVEIGLVAGGPPIPRSTGQTDAEGRVTMKARAGLRYAIGLASEDGLAVLPHRLEPLPRSGSLRTTVSLDLGELTIDLAPDVAKLVEWPCVALLTLDGPGGTSLSVGLYQGLPAITFTSLPVGSWEARLEFLSTEGWIARVEPDGDVPPPAPIWSARATVTITTGASARVRCADGRARVDWAG